jgi:excinuclease UvrABC nuclease subunit
VYVILRVNRVMGLPLQSEPLYVGKTRNLRHRMGMHLDPATAHNEHVGAVRDREALEFWCNLMPREQITSAEKILIQAVNPTANKIRY